MEEHSPPSLPLLPEQEHQGVLDEDEEETVALGVRTCMFEPCRLPRCHWLKLFRAVFPRSSLAVQASQVLPEGLPLVGELFSSYTLAKVYLS